MWLNILERQKGESGKYYDKRTKNHTCIIERLSSLSAINSNSIGDKSAINSNSIGDKIPRDFDQSKCIAIIEYAKSHAEFRSQEVAVLLGLQSSRTRDYLNALVDIGILIRTGANKNRTYKLK